MARLREHEAVVSVFDALRVDPRKLQVQQGFNVRDFDTPQAIEALSALKESIRAEGGVIVPLEIRMIEDQPYIVSGHRRHRAVMELIAEGIEIASVPATIEARTVNDAERTLRLITMNSGEPLTMLEKAEVVRRLLTMGWPRERVRDRLGYKTPAMIANFELLLSAPEDLRQAVRNDEISASTAIEMVRSHGDRSSERLTQARHSAKSRGKSRITAKDTPKKGKRTAAATEAVNVTRLQQYEMGLRDDCADICGLVETLRAFVARPNGIRPLAEAYREHTAKELLAVSDWLYSFTDAVRQAESDRAGTSENTELPPAARAETSLASA